MESARRADNAGEGGSQGEEMVAEVMEEMEIGTVSGAE